MRKENIVSITTGLNALMTVNIHGGSLNPSKEELIQEGIKALSNVSLDEFRKVVDYQASVKPEVKKVTMLPAQESVNW